LARYDIIAKQRGTKEEMRERKGGRWGRFRKQRGGAVEIYDRFEGFYKVQNHGTAVGTTLN
jgi:hypothetical protein